MRGRPTVNINVLVTAREARYRGEGNSIAPAMYNTVEELFQLREAGYLIGPDARTIAVQKFSAHKDDPHYTEAAPGQATARHWTADEIDSVRACYWRGEHLDRIRSAFPAETVMLDRTKWFQQSLTDPDLFGTFNDPPPDVSSLDPDVRRSLSENMQRRLDETWRSSP